MTPPGPDEARPGFELPLDPDAPIAVVIPMFEAERFILRALRSVAAQTVRPREVIVVDDGSTDDGPALASAGPGVRLVRQANAGPGAARNTGVTATSAPWVAFLDADDVWFPTHLAALLRVIADVPEAGLVSTRHIEVRGPRIPAVLPCGHRQRPRRGRRIDYFRRTARRIDLVWSSATAVRTSALEEVGGFTHEGAGEDLALWARIALRHPVGVSRSVTALYVRGTGGIMERASVGARDTTGEWVPLRELSPSIRAVLAEADRRRHDVSLRSIELYIDGRVTSNWRRVLVRAAQPEARKRLHELHHPAHWTAWFFRAASLLPEPFGRCLARTLGKR